MALLTFGSIYFSTPTATTLAAATPLKASGTTTTMKLAGFLHPSSNRLTYDDTVTRTFEIMFTGSVTKGGGGATQSQYFLYKNGSLITGSTISRTISSATDAGAFAVSAQVDLANTDYVEFWLETDTGDDLTIQSGVLSAKVLG